MRIAVDVMGGDFAPKATIQGSLQAINLIDDLELVLVGQDPVLKKGIEGVPRRLLSRVETLHAEDVIASDEEHPARAVRRKKDSSMAVGLKLVADGEAAGFVSAGNTGALMAGAMFSYRRIPGVERPALGAVLPSNNEKGTLVLDIGANADVRPLHLLQFAVMGQAYAEEVMELANPRIALLNIGEEKTKGNRVVVEAYKLFGENIENFVGNIQGRDFLGDKTDIIICEGFIGNIILKYTEGIAKLLFGLLKSELEANIRGQVGGLLIKPAVKVIKKRLDYSEYGGALLFGVNGVCVKCHGSSDARAIQNGIKAAYSFAKKGVVAKTAGRIKELSVSESSGE